ncbi:UDP-N-acetylmuramoyl-L-alanine--D-glutamate ligase [Adhaeribacter terreus]|uniref:UDP-N-acetylmuramoylalanine--D-glutamate ligase n=1 Tax=Adhaeribacter terreus TaxID=529703 RepID=A0ABW0E5P1_9BACT
MKIAVLGSGESGVGAALLAKAKGYDVFVSDMGQIKPEYREQLEHAGISFEEGTHTESLILDATEIVKSPGIPEKAPLIKAAHAKGIPVISEIEFAARYSKAKFVCITGTNGKTTTTLLTYHLLKSAGLNVGLAGNIGISLAKQVTEDAFDYYVLELSSFQLDNMYRFRAHIAVLLNITPDHLDRYEYKMENYAASKLRVTQNQLEGDYFIYNQEDPLIAQFFRAAVFAGQTIPFSLEKHPHSKVWFEGKNVVMGFAPQNPTVSTEKSPLIGKHNQYNSLAAISVAKLLGLSENQIETALATFKNAEHRLQKIGEKDGVLYINDSKATNVEAVWFALEGIKQPIVWIAGGVDKGNDYETLKPFAKDRIKALICLGADNEKLKISFGGIIPEIKETQRVEEAVEMAKTLAGSGDVVLLSPACASFDLFNNYEHRGHRFMEAVREIALK